MLISKPCWLSIAAHPCVWSLLTAASIVDGVPWGKNWKSISVHCVSYDEACTACLLANQCSVGAKEWALISKVTVVHMLSTLCSTTYTVTHLLL